MSVRALNVFRFLYLSLFSARLFRQQRKRKR